MKLVPPSPVLLGELLQEYLPASAPEPSSVLHKYAELLRPYSDAELADLEALQRLLSYRKRGLRG